MQCNSKMKYEWWVSDGERTAFVQLRRDFVPRVLRPLRSPRIARKPPRKTSKRSGSLRLTSPPVVWNAPLEESFRVEVVDEPLHPGLLPAGVDEHYFDDVPA